VKATEEDVAQKLEKLSALRSEISKVIIGQKDVVDELLITLFAGGHALLEGVPGLAKTLMIRTLADGIDADFRRIQFTPDLMPSDIVGTEILEEDHSTGKRVFTFQKGPVFTNILLADEINRTPPKTQAALLEAMQEYSVTSGGNSFKLSKPFFVLATQNPIEQAGTYPLPEAQLDRFLMYLKVDYPEEMEEFEVLKKTTGTDKPDVQPVMNASDVVGLQKLVREVSISDDLITYVNTIVRNTRPGNGDIEDVNRWVEWGAGPRAGQAMILTAKARALFEKRYAVTETDIQFVAKAVLRHRLLLNFKTESEGITPDVVTERILEVVTPPKSYL
jgi:MoxR-like ATPase